jgi:hypothetical protein
MGTITAGSILTKVSQILLDETNVRWPVADLLSYLNEAQRLVASMDEASMTRVAPAELEVGTVLQRLPDGARIIKDIPRNLTGSTPSGPPDDPDPPTSPDPCTTPCGLSNSQLYSFTGYENGGDFAHDFWSGNTLVFDTGVSFNIVLTPESNLLTSAVGGCVKDRLKITWTYEPNPTDTDYGYNLIVEVYTDGGGHVSYADNVLEGTSHTFSVPLTGLWQSAGDYINRITLMLYSYESDPTSASITCMQFVSNGY